jgi:LuxR family transcriptional regulator, maltose regulon positive regulatory protein
MGGDSRSALISPGRPPGSLARVHLLQLLDASASVVPLTLVVAGAGWGKTTLLSTWASTAPTAWMTVDAEHAERDAFWRLAVTALEGAGLKGTAAVSSSQTTHELLSALADAIAALECPIRLVLDEFDHVRDDTVATDIAQLLQRTRDRLSIVIASRSEPAFRLQRLRLNGLVAELRAQELAFTDAESVALLAEHDARLPDAETQLLWQRTEGWPAGLALVALALRGSPVATASQALAEAQHDLDAYWLEEVVSRQAPERLDLLLRTSMLPLVDAELADALTGGSDSVRLLAELAQEGLFVETDKRGTYRCRALLGEVLRAEAARRLGQQLPALHRQAARLLAQRELLFEAISCAIAGEDWEETADLLGQHWLRLGLQVGSPELRLLLDRVPAEVVRQEAELALAAAAMHLEAGEEPPADELLTLGTRITPRLPETRRVRATVTAVAIELYRARGAGDVEQSLQTARTALGDGWEHAVGPDVHALVLASLGATEFWLGDYDAAGTHLEQAAGLAEVRGNDYLLFLAECYAVAVDLGCGRLDDVRRRALAVDELARARGWGDLSHSAMAHLSLGAAHLWAHELEAAEHRIERARHAVEKPRERLPHVAVAQARATLLGIRGEPATALEVLRRAHAAGAPLPRPLEISGAMVEADLRLALGELEPARSLLEALDAPEAAIGLARVELAAGDPRAAAVIIARFRSDERSFLRPYANVEAWLIDAVAHDILGEGDAALRSLERALHCAEPRGFRHPFLRLGTRVRSLLRRQLRFETAHRALVDDLLLAFDAGEPARGAGAGTPAEPLSERELTVLRFLPTMMSNAEIAAEMFVSVNTVKTHLRHVYAKLGTTNRREAVRRARELRLLGPGIRSG